MRQYLNRKTTTLVVASIIVLLLAIIGLLGWKYYDLRKNPDLQAKATTARVLQKVGDLYLLPKGEEPTVAQIQDKNKLGKQDFFKNAQNGDFLLIYSKARVALLYREETNKLINVGPVNIENNNDQTTTQQTAQPSQQGDSSN